MPPVRDTERTREGGAAASLVAQYVVRAVSLPTLGIRTVLERTRTPQDTLDISLGNLNPTPYPLKRNLNLPFTATVPAPPPLHLMCQIIFRNWQARSGAAHTWLFHNLLAVQLAVLWAWRAREQSTAPTPTCLSLPRAHKH